MNSSSLRIRAFTLTEVMVSIAIVATLFAIVLPVMASAKQAAKETNCTVNLKNAMVAVNLYRADYEVSVPGSKPSEMGLPLGSLSALSEIQKCQEHPQPGWPYIQLWQTWEFNSGWAKVASESGEALPMIADINHRNQGKSLYSPYTSKFAIICYLDTHVSKRVAMGDASYLLTWIPSNGN